MKQEELLKPTKHKRRKGYKTQVRRRRTEVLAPGDSLGSWRRKAPTSPGHFPKSGTGLNGSQSRFYCGSRRLAKERETHTRKRWCDNCLVRSSRIQVDTCAHRGSCDHVHPRSKTAERGIYSWHFLSDYTTSSQAGSQVVDLTGRIRTLDVYIGVVASRVIDRLL